MTKPLSEPSSLLAGISHRDMLEKMRENDTPPAGGRAANRRAPNPNRKIALPMQIGDRFERLTVHSISHKDKHGGILWRCTCSCGNEVVARGQYLRSGMFRSCGCIEWEAIDEEIRPVPGFEGYYVSCDGTLYSDKANSAFSQRLISKLNPGPDKHGYRVMTVKKPGGGWRHLYAHVAVALTWIGPKPDGMEVCHNDGVISNCHYTNLRWDTHRANMQDKKAHGTEVIGEKRMFAKLTDEAVREIRDAYLNRTGRFWGRDELAQKFGVHPLNVTRAAKGLTWAHIVTGEEKAA